MLSYVESQDGQILEEGITEAGALASFIAAGTSYATQGVPMVPFFTFYSMFGFQRVGDLIWAASDARARGLPHGRHRGPHDARRRGPPAPGRAQPRARAARSRVCQAYDPAFAYELGGDRASRASTACTAPIPTPRTSSTT